MRSKMSSILFSTVAALLLILQIGACTSASKHQPEQVVKPKVVTITFAKDPDTLNPLYSATWFSAVTRELWLRSLWTFDDRNQPVPQLAVEVPNQSNGGIAKDGRLITVKLKPEAVWSDGAPVTADDFVFTYAMIMAERNTIESRHPYSDFVESVQAVDAHTLAIHFTEPYAPWQTSIFDYVLPKHVLEPIFQAAGTLDDAAWNRAPSVGIGPYVFSEWESGSHIIFKRNDKWFGPKPKLDQILIRIVPDDAAQVAAIKTGDTDLGTFLTYTDASDIQATQSATIIPVTSGYVEGWYLNFDPKTAHPALQDIRVRRALAFATDRNRITKDLLVGLTEPPVTFWDATPPYGNANLKSYPYDPEQARTLLDEAGWVDSNGNGTRDKNGVELILRFVTDERDTRQDVQAVVQQMWTKVGIGSKLVNYTSEMLWNSYMNDGPLANGRYDIAEYSSSSDFPDPEASTYWLCSEIPSPTNPEGSNWQAYCNPKLDALLKEQATTVDPQTRVRQYGEIEQIMSDDVVWIGMWKDPDLWSVNKRLTGVKFSGATPFWNVTEWDIAQ